MKTPNPANCLETRIAQKIAAIDAIADEFPGVILIHNVPDFSLVYISPRGAELLGYSQKEVVALGPEYYTRHFNTDEVQDQIFRMTEFLERNDEKECISIFQEVRVMGAIDWEWVLHLTSVKIFMRDENDKPLLTIGVALPVDPDHHITTKVARLLEENNFLRKNFTQFSKLSKREREILKLLALGNSSADIAEQLFLSVTTVETHRKNIRQKLGTSSSYELTQYARAFDLI